MKRKKIKFRTFVADFETSVYSGQEETEVWASALVELGSEQVYIFNSLDGFLDCLYRLLEKENIKVYFHNLRFDGSFLLDHWMRKTNFRQCYYLENPNNPYSVKWKDIEHMENGEFGYMISDMGQWYKMTLKLHDHILSIVDSYKLLPFSVDNIGKSFGTKHKKSSIEYIGERHAGGKITTEEREYIRNDVLVVKEALEIMFSEGHKKLTIGSCCLDEWRNILGYPVYKAYFPDLTKFKLDKSIYGSDNADAYIRRSYRGGWCYLVKGKEGKVFHNGITLDVNSLYPSKMMSPSKFPISDPTFWHGDYIPDEALQEERYYFIRVKTEFRIKPGYLPTIQIKHSLMYRENEYLETSEYKINGEYHSEKVMLGRHEISDRVVLTLTMTDWELMKDHYNLYETEILDGCWFFAKTGLFDEYIKKYQKIKMESTLAKRQCAKLFLNSLYGKTASNPLGGYKIAIMREDDTIGFYSVPENDRKTVFIALGSSITSYARDFTIRTAQKNYYGADKPGFIYADTDSMHMDIPIEQVKGVELSDTEFNKWKLESTWTEGKFLRQKTYVEHTEHGYTITACGMGKRCKELITQQLDPDESFEVKTEEEAKFLETKMTLDDIDIGLKIPSNLKQKRIKGGVVLVEDYFCLR